MANLDDTYPFVHGQPETDDQLDALQRFLDPVTGTHLDALDLQPGWRCWEVGAGAGSIANRLAHTVGPHGCVVASDIDISRLTPAANLVVDERDIRHMPAPPGAPFDLVHARLCLLFLLQRRAILAKLRDAVRPGGWLVIGEFDVPAPPQVLVAPTPQDGDLFTHVMAALIEVLTSRGADLQWARQVHTAMVDTGLSNVRAHPYEEAWTGGGGTRLYDVNSRQQHAGLRRAGITDRELTRFRQLMYDPGFTAMSYRFICTTGRRPA